MNWKDNIFGIKSFNVSDECPYCGEPSEPKIHVGKSGKLKYTIHCHHCGFKGKGKAHEPIIERLSERRM